MRWYEYKMEVDDLHVSDDLKAKLLAMQPAEEAPKPAKKPKKAIHFPRKALSIAACGLLCGVGLYAAVHSPISLLPAGGAALFFVAAPDIHFLHHIAGPDNSLHQPLCHLSHASPLEPLRWVPAGTPSISYSLGKHKWGQVPPYRYPPQNLRVLRGPRSFYSLGRQSLPACTRPPGRSSAHASLPPPPVRRFRRRAAALWAGYGAVTRNESAQRRYLPPCVQAPRTGALPACHTTASPLLPSSGGCGAPRPFHS